MPQAGRAPEGAPAGNAPGEPGGVEEYTTDRIGRRATLLGMLLALLGGGGGATLAWAVLRGLSLPAFSTSYVLRGLSTAGTCLILVLVGWLVIMWLRDDQRAREEGIYAAKDHLRPRWRVALTYASLYLAPAGLMVTTTGLPLAATPLYLDGLQSDQAFRTQLLTRMTDSPLPADMAYLGEPSYYPVGWFWAGGRFANLLGLSGWEAFQPWALASLAAAACMLVPVWQRITSSLPVGAAIALTSICIVMTMAPDEPYAAIITLGVPAATVLTRRALVGSRFATAALIVYLGVSATMYTLFTGVVAFSVLVIATLITLAAHRGRRRVTILHFAAIGLGSAAIALLAWGPYLMAVLSGRPRSGATATHYLPPEGVSLPTPFLAASVVGVLCLAGLVHLIVCVADPEIRTMGIALICLYLWALASMLAPLMGDTLLGFRLESVIVLQFAAAGVLGFAKLRLTGMHRLYPQMMGPHVRRVVTLVIVVGMCAAGLSYAQRIPAANRARIDHAYTDTDGDGRRADRFEADAARHYPAIDALIRERLGDPAGTVVLTEENNFLATRPYHGFQAFTSHYANPLGRFGERNRAIEYWAEGSWGELSEPDALAGAMDAGPWRGPDVLILRGDAEAAGEAADDDGAGDAADEKPGSEEAERTGGWKTHIAEDIFPNYPNVRYRSVFFNPRAFADPAIWEVAGVGPFVVAIRLRE